MRRVGRTLAVIALVVVAVAAAAADPAPPRSTNGVQLAVEREPPPRHLRIRPRAAQAAAPASAAPRAPIPAAPSASGTNLEQIEDLERLRDVLQPISISVNLGYQVDGARASGERSLGLRLPVDGIDYSDLRSYGFGEVFASTRGLVFPSLSTYFAARFQVAREQGLTRRPSEMDPSRTASLATPIATWFERSGPELRTGWAEVKDFLPPRWGLSRLRVRAGDQFIYGPWIVHLNGINVAYEGPTVTAAAYAGRRHPDYARDQKDYQPLASGGELRLDLRGLTERVPIAFSGEYLRLGSDDKSRAATDSAQIQVDWRPRRDVAVIAQQRWLDGALASQRIEVRTRYRDVTNLVFEGVRRKWDDWLWDPTLVKLTEAITNARLYLDFGPVVPQILLSARGGILIAENLDLFARVAAAPQVGKYNPDGESYAAPYLELAGAIEGRLRRQIAVGVSVLSRDTNRPDVTPVLDERFIAQPLPTKIGAPAGACCAGSTGEESFIEVGATARMTLGARRFSALAEIYGRRTHYLRAYEDAIDLIPESDLRGGGRFTIDAWIGKRLRLFASYDVSSALATAPEISGYKSLRLVVSGVY